MRLGHRLYATALGALIGGVGIPVATAQPIGNTLVRDIHTGPASPPLGSFPFHYADGPTFSLFGAASGATGREPWVTDGTPQGTLPLGELKPGPSSSLAVAAHTLAIALGNTILFAADDSTHGTELWRTDGLPQNTQLVVDLIPGPTGSAPSRFVLFQGLAYFIAYDGSGYRVFRTDGTAAGTSMAIDLEGALAIDVGSQSRLIAGTNVLYILNSSGSGDPSLYASNGTTAGTTFVKTFSGFQAQLKGGSAIGDHLLFGLDEKLGSIDHGIWISDGTSAGTQQLTAGDDVAWTFAANGRGYFIVRRSSSLQLSLAVVDVNPVAIQWLGDFLTPVSTSEDIYEPVPFGAGIAFVAGSFAFATGYELFVTDGTIAGTKPVADIAPGPLSSLPQRLRVWNGLLLFTADDQVTGRELWASSGTPQTTYRVADLAPGVASTTFYNERSCFVAPGGMVLGKDTAVVGIEPWVSNGQASGTKLLVNANEEPGADSDIELLTRLRDRVFFVADDGVHGRELWVSDGTPGGTTLFMDFAPGPQSGGPTEMVVFRDALVFDAVDPGDPFNRELWISDGTVAGTKRLLDINPATSSNGSYPSLPEQLTVADDQVFFVAHDGVHGYEVWRTDGTSAGTRLTRDLLVATPTTLYPTVSDSRPRLYGAAGNRAFFYWREYVQGQTDTGYEVCISDGTAAGTMVIADSAPGSQSSGAQFGVTFGDLAGYSMDTPGLGWELWISDGTASGTGPLTDINSGPAGSYPQNFSRFGDRLLFSADDGTSSFVDLYITDGTGAGTRKLIPASGLGPAPYPVWDSTGPLAYFYTDPSGNDHLWRTDGTPAGTFKVHTFPYPLIPPAGGSRLLGPVGADGHYAFAAQDASGIEMWIADGTVGGVFRLTDSNSSGDGLPGRVVRAGAQLFFAANDGVTGFELHALPFGETTAFDAVTFGVGCSSLPQAPSVTWSGSFALSQAASIDLVDAAPNATSLLLASALPGLSQNGQGCRLYVDSPAALLVATTDAQGALSLPFVVPNLPFLVGLPLYFQFAVAEPAGPFLGAAGVSDALELLVGS